MADYKQVGEQLWPGVEVIGGGFFFLPLFRLRDCLSMGIGGSDGAV